jgi:acyl dehydratase
MSEGFYFEDLTVGQTFCSPGALRIDAERIQSFGVEFDPQPAHVHADAAAQTPFGGLVASGWHTAAATMRLMLDTMRIAGGGQGLGVETLTWPHPVRPDDELRVEIEVAGLRPSRSRPGQGIVTLALTTVNQNGQTVQRLTLLSLFPRRSG